MWTTTECVSAVIAKSAFLERYKQAQTVETTLGEMIEKVSNTSIDDTLKEEIDKSTEW